MLFRLLNDTVNFITSFSYFIFGSLIVFESVVLICYTPDLLMALFIAINILSILLFSIMVGENFSMFPYLSNKLLKVLKLNCSMQCNGISKYQAKVLKSVWLLRMTLQPFGWYLKSTLTGMLDTALDFGLHHY